MPPTPAAQSQVDDDVHAGSLFNNQRTETWKSKQRKQGMFANDDDDDDNQPLFGNAPPNFGSSTKKEPASGGLFGDGALKDELGGGNEKS